MYNNPLKLYDVTLPKAFTDTKLYHILVDIMELEMDDPIDNTIFEHIRQHATTEPVMVYSQDDWVLQVTLQ